MCVGGGIVVAIIIIIIIIIIIVVVVFSARIGSGKMDERMRSGRIADTIYSDSHLILAALPLYIIYQYVCVYASTFSFPPVCVLQTPRPVPASSATAAGRRTSPSGSTARASSFPRPSSWLAFW